jgi:HD superfamily phosphodiesterase
MPDQTQHTIQTLWSRAALDMRGTAGNVDSVVWEHSVRVAHLTETIMAMPEVAHHVIDRIALTAAALYHDAGWLLDLREGRVTQEAMLLKRTTDEQRERAAAWMMTCLADVLEPGRLRLAARIITECNDRSTHLLEAQILADAENLDHVGPQAVWFMVRRQLAEHRSLDQMIANWQQQSQYGYWPLWIKESLRFPSAQRMAEERWKAMDRFMEDVRHSCALTSDEQPEHVPAATQEAPTLAVSS